MRTAPDDRHGTDDRALFWKPANAHAPRHERARRDAAHLRRAPRARDGPSWRRSRRRESAPTIASRSCSTTAPKPRRRSLASAAAATAAPLNPSYRADEFEFYLTDLRAKLLVVAQGKESPAVAVATRLGIPIARARAPQPERGAGTFDLAFASPVRRRSHAPRRATRRRHRAGAAHVGHDVAARRSFRSRTAQRRARRRRTSATTLALTADDRGLVHHAAVPHPRPDRRASSRRSRRGGSVSCTPRVQRAQVLRLDGRGAADVVHRRCRRCTRRSCSRAPNNADIVAANPLRFIRSSSSSLPPTVIAELERVFGAPVIEAYGMTEAAHQMASNPLPPRPRKPGTVGLAAGPEVRVVDDGGSRSPPARRARS